MRAWVTVRYLLDLLAEQVAIRSGILLNDYDIKAIIENSPMKDFVSVFAGDPNVTFGVRPEFVEDLLRIIRTSIGNLPDTEDGMIKLSRRLRELQKSGYKVGDFIPAFKQVLENVASSSAKVIDEKEIIEISVLSGLPVFVVADIVLGMDEAQNRSLSFWQKVDRKVWDGVTPLSDLFKKEISPDKEPILMDQRFIDYLAVNLDKLDRIHWRNFERICAEFFNRNGYHVELGPGTADGGVDIRVWTEDKDRNGPPLILVQCKRYKEGNMVSIECVKAFWTDVEYESAQKGMIVTTSQVAAGGHKVCEARKWELDLVEGEKVRDWLKSMWRFQWKDDKQKRNNVGPYLLPPIVPLPRIN
ncbi:restriction endonuclease [Anaerospora hongkongensis]|uniref:restriction endonuclease n=1 Tax=Anaerospora hongkongensis TaxID=244830 RepID=UPI002897BC28|nr:restriction endonuclease [Anaerospora hongkongensis]